MASLTSSLPFHMSKGYSLVPVGKLAKLVEFTDRKTANLGALVDSFYDAYLYECLAFIYI